MLEAQFARRSNVVTPTARHMHPISAVNTSFLFEETEMAESGFARTSASVWSPAIGRKRAEKPVCQSTNVPKQSNVIQRVRIGEESRLTTQPIRCQNQWSIQVGDLV